MNNQKLTIEKKTTELASKRTIMAGTRTLLAYIRTAVVFVSLAFAFMKLDKHHPIDWFTIMLFVMSAITLIVGVIDYMVTRRMVQQVDNSVDNIVEE